MKVYLARHTAVAAPAGLCYGRSDVSLAPGVEEDAARLRAALPRECRVICSPSTRCRVLAALLALEHEVDPRLAELHFGTWENRLWSALPRGETEAWSADFVTRAPPGGESYATLAVRAEAALAEHRKTSGGRDLLFVTHAGVIRALLAPRRGLSLRDAFDIEVAFGSLHLLPEPAETEAVT